MTDLNHSVPINTSPTKVFAAIATQTGNQGWWTKDTVMDPKIGGKAEFGFEKRGVPDEHRETRSRPPGGVEMLGGQSGMGRHHADVEHPAQRERQPVAIYAKRLARHHRRVAACNSTWGELMYRLKANVGGKNPGPRWRE